MMSTYIADIVCGIFLTQSLQQPEDHASYEPVLMEVNAQGISVKDRRQSCVAYYNILSLQYCGMWPNDKRFVTSILREHDSTDIYTCAVHTHTNTLNIHIMHAYNTYYTYICKCVKHTHPYI